MCLVWGRWIRSDVGAPFPHLPPDSFSPSLSFLSFPPQTSDFFPASTMAETLAPMRTTNKLRSHTNKELRSSFFTVLIKHQETVMGHTHQRQSSDTSDTSLFISCIISSDFPSIILYPFAFPPFRLYTPPSTSAPQPSPPCTCKNPSARSRDQSLCVRSSKGLRSCNTTSMSVQVEALAQVRPRWLVDCSAAQRATILEKDSRLWCWLLAGS